MKKYLELLYFGAYYFEWIADRLIRRLLNPMLHWIIERIPYLIPPIKKRLAKGGVSPKKNADNVINYNNRLSEANDARMFEIGIGSSLTAFFLFAYFDAMIILRYFFGSDWGFIKINRANGLIIMTFLAIISGITSSVMIETIGQDKNVRKFRRQSRKAHHKALTVFIGSCVTVLILFYFLFMK